MAAAQKKTILFDVMDTIVKDPFYEHMPVHFNMTFKELLAAKHPTAWVDFEKGDLSEEQLITQFFKDGRAVDRQALKDMLVSKYEFLPGMQELLQRLKGAGYEMHIVSNYPMWYKLIEDKLCLSSLLPWTFISCEGPMKGYRKPDEAAFNAVVSSLDVPADTLIFVDDRLPNVEAALAAGLQAFEFSDAASCEQQLRDRGVEF